MIAQASEAVRAFPSFQKVVHSDPIEETGVTKLQIRRRVRMNIPKNGRQVEISDTITRVVAAGLPAGALLYVLAPEKLAGWIRAP